MLQRLHAPSGGQLSRNLGDLSPAGRDAIRHPHPEVLTILDPRPMLDEAAAIAERYAGGGLLVAESLATSLRYGGELFFGSERNVGGRLRAIADDLGIAIHVVSYPPYGPGKVTGGVTNRTGERAVPTLENTNRDILVAGPVIRLTRRGDRD